MIALTALGNRAAGQAGFGTYIGVAIMTFSVFISHPLPWLIPFAYASLFLWRRPSPTPWFHVPQKTGTWTESFARGLYILPYAFLLMIFTNNIIHLFLGLLAVLVVPVAYWLGFKYKRFPLELSEILAGMIVGVI